VVGVQSREHIATMPSVIQQCSCNATVVFELQNNVLAVLLVCSHDVIYWCKYLAIHGDHTRRSVTTV
jgi:hypothetical protein